MSKWCVCVLSSCLGKHTNSHKNNLKWLAFKHVSFQQLISFYVYIHNDLLACGSFFASLHRCLQIFYLNNAEFSSFFGLDR